MKNRIITSWILLSLFSLVLSSCKKEFDEPPIGELPNIQRTMTIAQLKAMHTFGAPDQEILTDEIIEGVVIADDRSGNFYKQLVFQDETAGMIIRLDANSLFNDFPIGRKIYVKLKGLFLGDYNGVYQINGPSEQALAEALIPKHVIGGQRGLTVTPRMRTISTLSVDDINTLIQLDSVEFNSADAGQPYADAINLFSANRTIKDCSNSTIVIRTSGYANFAGQNTPTTRGNLTAVMSTYSTGSTITPANYQLYIRDVLDVAFSGPRCDGSTGGGGGGGSTMTIADVRALFTGAATNAPSGRKINGIVISEIAGANFQTKNLVIQDATGGIVVRFDADHTFTKGDELDVTISGVEVSEFNGLMQLNNCPLGNAVKISNGNVVSPRSATISQINSNLNAWESTLVEIVGACWSGGSTYSGTRTLTDASGNIPVFTRTSATFAGATIPTTQTTVTAIIGDFNGAQLNLRNASDVVSTGGTCGGGGTGGNPVLVSIQDVRDLFSGTTLNISQDYKIRGVVTSDLGPGNITARNITLQDATAGIVVRFTANNTIALGQEVEIVVTGRELSEFNGLLQVNNVPNADATTIGVGTPVVPRVTTIADLLANAEDWESTVVRIEDVTLSGGATYSGTLTLTDATGNMDLFTRSASTFAASPIPAGQFTSITGVVSQFTTYQLNIRNLADIEP
jgi:hypothetical protein